MDKKLCCFISASNSESYSIIKQILEEQGISVFDIYDMSLGNSIQINLKRKLKEADFGIFIITNNNPNIYYEMGICEGLSKPHFIILNGDVKEPYYIQNKLFIKTTLLDKNYLKLSIMKFIEENTRQRRIYNIKVSNKRIFEKVDNKEAIGELLKRVKVIRKTGTGVELELVIGRLLEILNLKHESNIGRGDKGVDFAVWADRLGQIIGNPILIEVKYGSIQENTFKSYYKQIANYIEETKAKAALLLYLDKEGKRFKKCSTLYPLIINKDIEDLLSELMDSSFEKVLFEERNKIAHGQE